MKAKIICADVRGVKSADVRAATVVWCGLMRLAIGRDKAPRAPRCVIPRGVFGPRTINNRAVGEIPITVQSATVHVDASSLI